MKGRIIFYSLVALLAGWLVALLLPAMTAATSHGPFDSDMNDLLQIGKACKMYSMDHDDLFPDSFADLIPYADLPTLFVSRIDRSRVGDMSNVSAWASYTLRPGLTDDSDPLSVLAFFHPKDARYPDAGLILFADGSVRRYNGDDFRRTLKESPNKALDDTSQ